MNYRSLIRERKRGSRRGEKQVVQEKQTAMVRENAEWDAAMAACLSWAVTEEGATASSAVCTTSCSPGPAWLPPHKQLKPA